MSLRKCLSIQLPGSPLSEYIVPKPKRPGEIRLCIDMQAPNIVIQGEHHVTPTIDDIIANLNGVTESQHLI